VIVEERIKQSNENPQNLAFRPTPPLLHTGIKADSFLLDSGTKVEEHTVRLHGNASPLTSNLIMCDLLLSKSEVTCLYEKAAGVRLAYIASHKNFPFTKQRDAITK
jgi:hypothetical protein